MVPNYFEPRAPPLNNRDFLITFPFNALISLNHGSFVSEVGKAAQRADELGIT